MLQAFIGYLGLIVSGVTQMLSASGRGLELGLNLGLAPALPETQGVTTAELSGPWANQSLQRKGSREDLKEQLD